MKILKILFLCICFIISGSKTDSKGLNNDKLTVIISPTPKQNINSIPDTEVLFALTQYLDYQLFLRTDSYEIVNLPDNLTFDEYLAELSSQSESKIIFIQASGSIGSQIRYQKDSFSRRFVTLSNDLFTIALSATFYEYQNGGITEVSRKNILEKSKEKWFEFGVEQISLDDLKKFQSLPEPQEFVMQRAVHKLIETIPYNANDIQRSGEIIPATFYIDSSFIKSAPESWESRFNLMSQHTSKKILDQFGYGLQSKNLRIISLQSDSDYDMSTLFNTIKKSDLSTNDRLSVLLLNKNDRIEYFSSGSYDKVGLAEIGKNQIIINELPSPNKDQNEWQAFQNSLILIHEIGHTLGAIHVSDQYSVMNHSLNWLASTKFDKFNKRIITDALAGRLLFNNKIAYLTYLSDLLLTSNYHLVDIPFVYFQFINGSDNSPLFKKLLKNESYKPFLLAASGYGFLQNNFHQQAAKDFRKAITLLPNEASLYYYLSLATEGTESTTALTKAADLGYWLAKQKLSSDK